MRKLLFFIISACCFAHAALAMENVFSLSSYRFERGSTEKIYVQADITEERGGLQADMYLPGGVKIALNDKGRLQARMCSDGPWGDNGLTLAINDNGDFYTFLIYGPTGETLQADSGYLIEMEVETGADAKLGPAKVMFKNSILTSVEGKDTDLDDVEYDAEIFTTYSISAASSDAARGAVETKGGGDRVVNGSAVSVTATPAPGYEFVNWTSDGTVVSTENPYQFTASRDMALVANFKAGMYDVKFVFGNGQGDVVMSLEFGAVITAPENPGRTGYTFGGWNPALEEGTTVPVDGITYTAVWVLNQYKLTYTVDGEIYSEASVDFGSKIEPEAAPEKEGYTFNGWEGIPETMPAHDIEIVGSYTINSYCLRLYLNDELYLSEMIEFGAPVKVDDPEVPEGNKFDGWEEEIPEFMPAHDLNIYGTYSSTSSISSIGIEDSTMVTVYNLNGQILYKNVRWDEVMSKLKNGVYIINGVKHLIVK